MILLSIITKTKYNKNSSTNCFELAAAYNAKKDT